MYQKQFVRLSVLLLFIFGIRHYAYADAGYPTDSELNLLPPYCKARLRDVSDSETNRWKNIFGNKVWSGLHHYCQTLNQLNRANTSVDTNVKNNYLRQAYSGFLGQAEAYGPSFVLRHEAYYYAGISAERLGRIGDAVAALEKSISIKPRFSRSYMALGDLYYENGQRDEAIKVVQRGLSVVPKSKGLSRRKEKFTK